MATDSSISDPDSIGDELRAAIRKAGVDRSRTSGAGPRPEPGIEADLQVLRSTSDVAGTPFTTHRPVLGPFIIRLKNFTRDLLIQLLTRQSAYNSAAARVIADLNRRLNSLAEEQARMERRLAAFEASLRTPPLRNRDSSGSDPAVHADFDQDDASMLERSDQGHGTQRRS